LKVLKIVGWSAGGVIAFAIVLTLIALFVNRRDAEASAAAIRFEELYRDRPFVADDDNGFVFATDFDSVPDETVARDSKVKELLEACRPESTHCAATFDASDEYFDKWMATESGLLERYRKLISHTGWREVVPEDIAAEFPPYALVMDGQKLLLLQAKTLAGKQDYAGIKALLESDIRFWRMTLASSDILISKMIAVAALKRHFEWGSLILRKLPHEHVREAVPAEWRAAISAAERSMARCWVGEWKFMSGALRTEPDLHGAEQLFQIQASINESAEYFSRLVEMLDVSLDRYESAVQEADAWASRPLLPRSIYNLTGKMLLNLNASAYIPYVRRVADIEGARRAAAAAIELHEQSVELADVAAALAASPLRNPYNNKPFAWDAATRAILFQGLQQDRRGLHRIYY
jgi:hypothetical protein